MTLGQILELCSEYQRVDVYEKDKKGLLAQYDSKNSIPENLNRCEVYKLEDLGKVVNVSILPRVPSIAERVDKAMHDYDYYAYQDNDVSVENIEYWMNNNPISVIEDLLSIIEDYAEQIDALEVEAGYKEVK